MKIEGLKMQNKPNKVQANNMIMEIKRGGKAGKEKTAIKSLSLGGIATGEAAC
jgi:hypothetical protein